MSKANAKDFLKKLQDDKGFRRELEDASDDAARKKIVEDAGLDFTKEDLKAAAEDLPGAAPRASAAWTSTAASGSSAASAAAAAL